MFGIQFGPFGAQILDQFCDALPRHRVHRGIDEPSIVLDLGVEFSDTHLLRPGQDWRAFQMQNDP